MFDSNIKMLRNIAARSAPKVVKRANQWSEVSLRAVPLQADENEGEIEVREKECVKNNVARSKSACRYTE